MSEELEVLKVVAGRLAGGGIPYMVTGSIATSFYAVPRMTRDIDIVVELAEEDTDRVVALFQDDFYIDGEAVELAIRAKTMFNMIHNSFIIKVDMLVRKNTDYRREEFSRQRCVSVEGQGVQIVSPEDLILSKLEWARDTRSEVQFEDVKNLLRSVAGLDQDYLAHWAGRLGLEALYREVTQ